MYKTLEQEDGFKPVFSGHETFPLRYGWLKKVYDDVLYYDNEGKDVESIFNSPESISSFGVGKNMVASMHHWAIFTGMLTNEGVTSEAKKFFCNETGCDPWMEHPSTLWFIHWVLVKQPRLLTYHWFFNYYNGYNFDRKLIKDNLMDICVKHNFRKPSDTTLKRDVECFIRMYVGKDSHSLVLDDDSIESPLSELSLIRRDDRYGMFSHNKGKKHSLSIGVFLLCLAHFWKDLHLNSSSLSFEAMMFDPCSPGRIFLLDEESLIEKIYEVAQAVPDLLTWSETAGMRQFIKKTKVSIQTVIDRAEIILKKDYK